MPIEVRIGGGGNVRIETKGFKGQRCTDVDKFLTDAFGDENVDEEEKTSEFYEEGEIVGEVEVISQKN